MRRIYGAVMVVMLFLSAAAVLYAEAETKFYGYQWIRYVLQYDGEIQSENGIIIPRTYIRWRMADEEAGYAGNITLDIANAEGAQNGIDWGIWIKNGYVEFNRLPVLQNANMRLRIGVQPVYFGTLDVWDYPLIEKPFEDRDALASSADLGAAIVGTTIESLVKYEIAVYNGSGYRHIDNDEFKRIMGSLQFNLLGVMFLRVSIMDDRDSLGDAFILAFDTERIKGYADYVKTAKKTVPAVWDGNSYVAEGLSLYLGAELFENLWLNLRLDNWNPDTAAPGDDTTTYISGLQFIFSKNIELQFNYELTQAYETPNRNQWLTQVKWAW